MVIKTHQPSGSFIHGISTAVPDFNLTVAQSIERLNDAGLPPRLVRLFQRVAVLTGIEKRHLAAPGLTIDGRPLFQPASVHPAGPGMAERSQMFDIAAAPLVAGLLKDLSERQLARAGALVTVSCTHASSPGLEQPVFLHSPVSPDVQRWNLGFMGCSAGLAAVRMIHQMADLNSPALIVACELSSLHFQYSDRLDQMTANVLFADGAAGLLMSAEASPVQVLDCRCSTFPTAAEQMVWMAGDNGLKLHLNDALPETLAQYVPGAIRRFLERNHLAIDQIDHWLVHPGGPQILQSVQESLGLNTDALSLSLSVLRRFGNMSSPTIFFILKDLLDSGATGRTVALAFGPGLTVEMTLLQIDAHYRHAARS